MRSAEMARYFRFIFIILILVIASCGRTKGIHFSTKSTQNLSGSSIDPSYLSLLDSPEWDIPLPPHPNPDVPELEAPPLELAAAKTAELSEVFDSSRVEVLSGKLPAYYYKGSPDDPQRTPGAGEFYKLDPQPDPIIQDFFYQFGGLNLFGPPLSFVKDTNNIFRDPSEQSRKGSDAPATNYNKFYQIVPLIRFQTFSGTFGGWGEVTYVSNDPRDGSGDPPGTGPQNPHYLYGLLWRRFNAASSYYQVPPNNDVNDNLLFNFDVLLAPATHLQKYNQADFGGLNDGVGDPFGAFISNYSSAYDFVVCGVDKDEDKTDALNRIKDYSINGAIFSHRGNGKYPELDLFGQLTKSGSILGTFALLDHFYYRWALEMISLDGLPSEYDAFGDYNKRLLGLPVAEAIYFKTDRDQSNGKQYDLYYQYFEGGYIWLYDYIDPNEADWTEAVVTRKAHIYDVGALKTQNLVSLGPVFMCDSRNQGISQPLKATARVNTYTGVSNKLDPQGNPVPATGTAFEFRAFPYCGVKPYKNDKFLWKFRDGRFAQGDNVVHYYDNPGEYSPRVMVFDAQFDPNAPDPNHYALADVGTITVMGRADKSVLFIKQNVSGGSIIEMEEDLSSVAVALGFRLDIRPFGSDKSAQNLINSFGQMLAITRPGSEGSAQVPSASALGSYDAVIYCGYSGFRAGENNQGLNTFQDYLDSYDQRRLVRYLEAKDDSGSAINKSQGGRLLLLYPGFPNFEGHATPPSLDSPHTNSPLLPYIGFRYPFSVAGYPTPPVYPLVPIGGDPVAGIAPLTVDLENTPNLMGLPGGALASPAWRLEVGPNKTWRSPADGYFRFPFVTYPAGQPSGLPGVSPTFPLFTSTSVPLFQGTRREGLTNNNFNPPQRWKAVYFDFSANSIRDQFQRRALIQRAIGYLLDLSPNPGLRPLASFAYWGIEPDQPLAPPPATIPKASVTVISLSAVADGGTPPYSYLWDFGTNDFVDANDSQRSPFLVRRDRYPEIFYTSASGPDLVDNLTGDPTPDGIPDTDPSDISVGHYLPTVLISDSASPPRSALSSYAVNPNVPLGYANYDVRELAGVGILVQGPPPILTLNPIVTPSSGYADMTSFTFDARPQYGIPPYTFQWDWTNDGILDGAQNNPASHIYPFSDLLGQNQRVITARVRVTDSSPVPTTVDGYFPPITLLRPKRVLLVDAEFGDVPLSTSIFEADLVAIRQTLQFAFNPVTDRKTYNQLGGTNFERLTMMLTYDATIWSGPQFNNFGGLIGGNGNPTATLLASYLRLGGKLSYGSHDFGFGPNAPIYGQVIPITTEANVYFIDFYSGPTLALTPLFGNPLTQGIPSLSVSVSAADGYEDPNWPDYIIDVRTPFTSKAFRVGAINIVVNRQESALGGVPGFPNPPPGTQNRAVAYGFDYSGIKDSLNGGTPVRRRQFLTNVVDYLLNGT